MCTNPHMSSTFICSLKPKMMIFEHYSIMTSLCRKFRKTITIYSGHFYLIYILLYLNTFVQCVLEKGPEYHVTFD